MNTEIILCKISFLKIVFKCKLFLEKLWIILGEKRNIRKQFC